MASLPSPLLRAWITPEALRAILGAQARALEAAVVRRAEPCGLLLGTREGTRVRIREAPDLRNVAPRAGRGFGLDPDERLRVASEARARGLGAVGFWHGHLEGAPVPSRADVEGMEEAEPGVQGRSSLLVIVGRGRSAVPVVRAWALAGGGVREVPLGA